MTARRSAQYQRAAVSYAARLRGLMEKRGLSRVQLARQLGISPAAVGMWVKARNLPNAAMGERLAEVLADNGLEPIARRGRTIACAVCGRTVFRGATRRRYCGEGCWTRAARKGAPPGYSLERAAIDAFCHECEPDGVCRTPTCVLQPLSPLPLIELHRRAA